MSIHEQNHQYDVPVTGTHLKTRTLDSSELRTVFGAWPSGVAAVCAVIDGEAVGMAVSTFTPVSLDPPLVSMCIQNTSGTWPRLRRASTIGVSILGIDGERAARQLSSKTGDRFSGLTTTARPTGAVYLAEACAWFDCTVEAEVPAGDHLITVLRIVRSGRDEFRMPLVFHASQFRRLAEASPHG